MTIYDLGYNFQKIYEPLSNITYMPNAPTIVHINNVAAQASMIRFYMPPDRYRNIIVAAARNDLHRIADQYESSDHVSIPNYPMLANKPFYLYNLWREARRADIIHAHSIVSSKRYLPILRRLLAGRAFIMHYHGSDVRMTSAKVRRWFEQNATAVLVSTPDMLSLHYAAPPVLVNTMVNVKMFSHVKACQNGQGLCIMKAYQSVSETMERLRAAGYGDIDWTFVRRPPVDLTQEDRKHGVRLQGIPYASMPRHLAAHEWYADIAIEKGKLLDARSITGVEAALAGCKVVDGHGKVHGPEIAEPHLPTRVIEHLVSVYDGIMNSDRRHYNAD